ncbi:glycosyltransferase family 4 protein [Leifsonia sp. A12D58]|uniref:glycosyltransferase family 4 protein n=1 Tax=Leifsonia sp. A12D58 TaxID=3397674 RepID=UPI0039DF840F
MLTLVPGGMGGSETYARALTGQLATTDAVSTTAFVPEAARGFGNGLPEYIVSGIPAGGSTTDRLRAVATLNLRAPSIRRALSGVDVVHYPFTVPVPKPNRSQASVQSLLDVQHLELPHMFSKAELLYRKRYYEGFAKRADAVITISDFAKRRMVELLGIDADRIHVAHLGVDTDRFTPNLGERENFVLYPARGWPHKNHATLIAGMEIARKSNPELRLVLTGGGLGTLGDLPDWVDRKGLVSQDELLHLYRTAGALVFPSLYEGFGLPPLEAMASGCPVAVSNAGSLPEVVGDAAVLFDPHSPEAIAEGVSQALQKSDELTAAGLQQVKKFTWERCLDVHLSAYADAVEVHG